MVDAARVVSRHHHLAIRLDRHPERLFFRSGIEEGILDVQGLPAAGVETAIGPEAGQGGGIVGTDTRTLSKAVDNDPAIAQKRHIAS